MALSIPEFYEFGGVDSRSNPLSMPKQRALRSRNWVIRRDGHLALRKGYTEVSQSTVTATPIHSPCSFQMLDGTKYLIYFQGTTPKVLNLETGTVSTPTVKGKAFASSNRFSYYLANNRLHAVNGVDQKWFDGSTWRDIGIRSLTQAEVDSITIVEGVRELTSAEAAAVTSSSSGSGTFTGDAVGRYVYVALFDTNVNELGPATIPAGARVKVGSSAGISVSGLPNLSTVNTGWKKLLAITDDNNVKAYFCTNTETTITSVVRAGNVLTYTAAGHGLSTGDVIMVSGSSLTAANVMMAATVSDADTFILVQDGPNESGTGGKVKRIVSVDNATTTGTIADPTVDTSYLVNEERGVAASVVGEQGSVQPGYEFYLCLYNRDGGEHIGNRIKVGKRMKNTTRCNFRINGLPDPTAIDPEYFLLIGRTRDGAEVPFICQDAAGNYAVTQDSGMVLMAGKIDGASELPLRNGVPSGLRYAASLGDYVLASPANSNKVFRSGSVIESENGDYVGCPEQSWPVNNVQLFPTGGMVTSIAEYNLDGVVGTMSDCATLDDQSGVIPGWHGPWATGVASHWAFTKGWKNLPYWLTGDKQLATITLDGPITVSDEYEAALLAKIGDSYLSQSEVVYQRDAKGQLDRLVIKGRDKDGKPFIVIHDFNLRDERSPYGQGYEVNYAGPLASDFTLAKVRDANDREVIYACASNGKIYQLDKGYSDAGTEFEADSIQLINIGSSRPTLEAIEWYGDKNVKFELFTSLDANLDTPNRDLYELLDTPTTVFLGDNNFHYQCDLSKKELPGHVYLRVTLQSHSADAPSVELTDPPNMPVETYGQVFMLAPQINGARPR